MITRTVRPQPEAAGAAAAAAAPSASPLTRMLSPTGIEDVRQRDVVREFVRGPMILSIPASVAVLTEVGLHSMLAAIPCALVLATAATLTAVHRAAARVSARNALAAVTEILPKPRASHES